MVCALNEYNNLQLSLNCSSLWFWS